MAGHKSTHACARGQAGTLAAGQPSAATSPTRARSVCHQPCPALALVRTRPLVMAMVSIISFWLNTDDTGTWAGGAGRVEAGAVRRADGGRSWRLTQVGLQARGCMCARWMDAASHVHPTKQPLAALSGAQRTRPPSSGTRRPTALPCHSPTHRLLQQVVGKVHLLGGGAAVHLRNQRIAGSRLSSPGCM